MLSVGPFRLHLLETESMALDGGAMFGVIPKTLWNDEIPADAQNRIRLSTRPLLIQYKDRNVLIDAGIGDKSGDKFNRIYEVRGSHVLNELSKIGLRAEQITDVVVTHFHFDHCGGLTRLSDGKPVLTFPKARYLIQKQAIENTLHSNPREKASFLPENIEPVLDSGRVEQLEGTTNLFDGVELITQFGHTIAMQIPKISAANRTYLYPCDTIPTAAHLRVSWVPAYDILPIVTMREKNNLLKQAIQEKWTLIYAHDPKFQATTVKFDGKHFAREKAAQI
jgi:glyoxylase-like metal-dependent hydrolase (beta-lactamase superfamily II)